MALIVALLLAGCSSGEDAPKSSATAMNATTTGETSTNAGDTQPGKTQEDSPPDDTPLASPDEIQSEESATSKSGKRYRQAEAVSYRHAKTVCKLFAVEDLAKRYDVAPKAKTVARAYTVSAFAVGRREAPFEGCLDGFAG